VWLLTTGIIVCALALWTSSLRGLTPLPAPVEIPWWALALVFFLTDSYVVHVQFRREAHTISLDEIGLVVGLVALGPGALLLARLLGGGAALYFHRRQRSTKLAFNLAQSALVTAVAVLVFRSLLGEADPYGPAGWAAALAATVAASLCGIALVTAVITLAEGRFPAGVIDTASVSLAATLATTSLTLVAILVVESDPLGILLLLVPAAVGALGFWGYMRQRNRGEHLEFLYESMRTTQSAPEFGLAIGRLLVAARELVRADFAEIVLFAEGMEVGMHSTSGPNGETLMRQEPIESDTALMIELAGSAGEALLLPRTRPPHLLDDYLETRGLEDAMAAPLREDGQLFGVLLVGNRAGDVMTFTQDDRELLETFSGHASVLIENGRLERSLAELTTLKEELRHRAFHDALTDLPNRALLAERISTALARDHAGGRLTALVYLDLDDFKTINDSRGHAAGDQLLVQVAARVTSCVRPEDTPSRLGGDEFAILLEDTTEEGASAVAQRVMDSLKSPFDLDGSEISVRASAGVAFATDDSTADELLRNADVAMYSAKTQRQHGLSLYEPAMHARVRRRHELALALERAVEDDRISVVYQPIVSLSNGRIEAVEALARWPRSRGETIQPSEFIPIAEEAGHMELLGERILRTACSQATAWQAEFPSATALRMNVNLSPRELKDDGLAPRVMKVLEDTGLDPSCLTLEITEAYAMDSGDEALERMQVLYDLGVRLALDDFGTGYSSLARLEAFPLDVLKLAQPFVSGLADDDRSASLIEAFLRIASTFGLSTVAEGVEHPAQRTRLDALGCPSAQGFLFARPGDASTIARLLAAAERDAAVA
jgi:diguanylate cyclase (GGDEF)-like protein